jgi:hypothetical protein
VSKTLEEELEWLQNNPAFDERPASITEFLGPDYLNIEGGVRPGVRKALVDIFGEESNGETIARVQRAIMTGAIGIGKTTLASIALPYMCHWVLCLSDPQDFFDLLPGSRIAFMQMSTSEDQAKQVLFGDIFARINHSPWFKKFPYDSRFKNQIRFPKDIWVVPGDSSETTFEGYNILGGILDEIDSHKVTPKKDYAQSGYDTINSRIESRYGTKGLLILIGQMKASLGFAAKKYKEFKVDPDAAVARMSIWESFGWDDKRFNDGHGNRKSFWYDPRRKGIVPDVSIKMGAVSTTEHLIEIPRTYMASFLNDPEKALRDLAGIPPLVGAAFIGMGDRIYEARDRWNERFPGVGSPVRTTLSSADFESWFRAPDTLPRAAHLDIAYASDGDALGLAMGHVPEVKEIDGELRPVIVFDFLLRMRPMPGYQLILSDIRQIIYYLRDDLGFKIEKVTMDGFQSTDMMQQLQKRRVNAEYLSVDKKKLPYQDLRDALYERRVEFPQYITHRRHGDVERVEIAIEELSQLVDAGPKIDHPDGGSKDVADAMAGVVHTLMGDRKYRRGVSSVSPVDGQEHPTGGSSFSGIFAPSPLSGLAVPSLPVPGSLLRGAPNLPDYLRPRNR